MDDFKSIIQCISNIMETWLYSTKKAIMILNVGMGYFLCFVKFEIGLYQITKSKCYSKMYYLVMND